MIEVNGLVKSLGGNKVLDHLNLKVFDGETLVIIGRSGCGKSVLLKHIMGLLQPDDGKIIIDGKDITDFSEKEMNKIRIKFGMLFQGAALFDSLTVKENIAFNMYEHAKEKEQVIAERVEQCLQMVGLKGVENKKPAELSGGMKKRIGLARAICMNPEVILYDEPTTGLDPIMSDVINDLINELHDRLDVTSIVVTHDMTSAYKIANRIAMLYKGKIIALGTPDEIKNTDNPIVKQFISGASIGPIKIEE